jgi:RNA polymerase sigma-70 factor (ECF subfamily)
MGESTDITRLLHAVEDGRDGALDELMQAVYADLQGVAERHMAREFGRGLPGITMEPAALVNESFLRLIRQRKRFDNRGHFFAIATKVMLRVLVDYQRSRGAAKRGGGRKPITLSMEGPQWANNRVDSDGRLIEVGTLASALEKLERLDPRKADVVKMRVLWGLEMREIATSLGISLSTVERDWAFAKAWLARESAEAGAAR